MELYTAKAEDSVLANQLNAYVSFLSFFGRRDLADLTETIMGDVKITEHAYSHVLHRLYGAYVTLGICGCGAVCF